MSLKFKMMRSASGYKPGTPAEYEPARLQHFGEMPKYETHTRTIRELGPVIPSYAAGTNTKDTCRRVVYWDESNGSIVEQHFGRTKVISGGRREVLTRTVTKIIMSADGKTPRSPKINLVKREIVGKPEGLLVAMPVTELIPIGAPVRLKKGSPKAIYRMLKRIERTVGLDSYYARMAKEAGVLA